MKGKDILRLIEFLITADSSMQSSILKTVSEEFIQFIGETALNILEEVLPLSKHFKNKLLPHAEFIRSLGSKKIKAENRRRLCIRDSEVVVLIFKAVQSELIERFG